MTPFIRRWMANNLGDIRYSFWSDNLMRRRLGRGLDESGRGLCSVPVGRVIF